MADNTKIFPPGWRAEDDDGVIIAGGTLEFFAAGTTDPLEVFSDADLSVSLGTTVGLNAGGYPVSSGGSRVLVYTGTAPYRVRCKDDDAVVVWEHDNVSGALDTGDFDDIIAAQLPSGTVQLFGQTNAPPGWTKSVSNDDACPRIVSGTASSGGSNGFSVVFANRTLVHGNIPSYTQVATSLTFTLGPDGSIARRGPSFTQGGSNGISALATEAAIGFTSSIGGNVPSGGSGTALSFDPKYVDFIVATKD